MIESKVVAGNDVLNYIQQELSKGGVLSACISKLSLANGTIYAFVPARTSEGKLYDFENGGLYPFDGKPLEGGSSSIPIQNEARLLVVETIQQYLASREVNCCLFEDQLRSPTDPLGSSSVLDYVHLIGGQIFYFFNSKNNGTSLIYKALATSEAHVFLCALSYLDQAMQTEFLPNKEITLTQLEKFAGGVSIFFLKAYDYEGYLMWVKKQ